MSDDFFLDELSQGIRERIVRRAEIANMSPAAWLRERNLNPAEFGIEDPAPTPDGTTPATSAQPTSSEIALAMRAGIARLEQKIEKRKLKLARKGRL